MPAIRTLELRTADGKVWFFRQKETRRVGIFDVRMSEREAAVLALQGPSRH